MTPQTLKTTLVLGVLPAPTPGGYALVQALTRSLAWQTQIGRTICGQVNIGPRQLGSNSVP